MSDLTAQEVLQLFSLGERNFSNLDLSEIELAEAELPRINLTRTNLTGAKLICINLTSASLREANLSGANLKGADLTSAYLTQANLTNAYFEREYTAKMDRAILIGTNFEVLHISERLCSYVPDSRNSFFWYTIAPDGTTIEGSRYGGYLD